MPRPPSTRILLVAVAAMAMAACAHPRPTGGLPPPAPAVAADSTPAAAWCDACSAVPFDSEVMHAVALRVSDLKSRGGSCQTYAAVLEGSLAGNHIQVRPFMWRVGSHLASAQAQSTGEIVVAREVDALNVGVRSLDDVVHSLEHEAAHIAFSIPSGGAWTEAMVDARVSECRAPGSHVGSAPQDGDVRTNGQPSNAPVPPED